MLRLQNYAEHDNWPTQLNRLKEKALQGALEALNSRKNKRDLVKEILKSRIEHLKVGVKDANKKEFRYALEEFT